MEEKEDPMDKLLGFIESLKEAQEDETKKRISVLEKAIEKFSLKTDKESKEIAEISKKLIEKYTESGKIARQTEKLQKDGIKISEEIKELERERTTLLQNKASE